MLAIVPRKCVETFDRYFRGDFGARMWDVGGNPVIPRSVSRALFRGDRRAISSDIRWRPLSPEEFYATVERMAGRYGWRPKPSGRVPLMGLELVFSPPKSYSAAALAGPSVDRMLVFNHQQAVSTALSFLPEMLVTRRTKETRRLDPIDVEALRFVHPWSRKGDPLVHDHVVLLWYLEGSGRTGALHTYPLIFYQMTLRVLYHYALIAGLKGLGYGVRIGDPGTLRWELEGIKDRVIEGFSKRARMIHGHVLRTADGKKTRAAKRIAGLVTRNLLLKSDPTVSLEECRERWAKEFSPELCVPHRGQIPVIGFEIGEVAPYFLPSAVTTRLRLFGRLLVDSLGMAAPVSLLWRELGRELERKVGIGDLLLGPGNTVCHPGVFEAEEEIVGFLRRGLGAGWPAEFKERCPRPLASALNSGDRARVISIRDDLPNLDSDDISVEELPGWDPFRAVEFFRENSHQTAILAVRAEAHAGDFLAHAIQIASSPPIGSLAKAGQFRIDDKPVVVRKGSIPHAISRDFPLPWLRKPTETMIFVRADMDESSMLAWNISVTKDYLMRGPEEGRSDFVYLEKPIPWGIIDEGFSWPGKVIMAMKACSAFELYERRTVESVLPSGWLKLIAVKRPRKLPPSFFRKRSEALVVLEKRRYRLVKGDQYEILLSFQTRTVRLEQGEIVLVRALREDNSIELMDGRVVPPGFRALAPMMFFPAAPKAGSPPDVVVVQEEATEGLWNRLRNIGFGKKLIVFTPDLVEMRSLLGTELRQTLSERKSDYIRQIVENDNEFSLLPSRKYWRENLETAEILRAKIASRNPATENSVGELDEGASQPLILEAEAKPSPDHDGPTASSSLPASSVDAEGVEVQFSVDGVPRRKPSTSDEEQPKIQTPPKTDPEVPFVGLAGDPPPARKKKRSEKEPRESAEYPEEVGFTDPNERIVATLPESEFVEVTIEVETVVQPGSSVDDKDKPSEDNVSKASDPGEGGIDKASVPLKKKVRKDTPSGDGACDIQ